MTEEWKDLPIHHNSRRYQVSNMGRIRSIRMYEGLDISVRLMRTCTRTPKKGNKRVTITLRGDGKQRNYDIHILVAKNFVDNPNGYVVVKHIDGNIENNAATNLMWVKKGQSKMFCVSKERTTKIMQRTIDWLYDQLNEGRIECCDIETLVSDYKKAMNRTK